MTCAADNMASAIADHKFNDDLLLREDDRALASRRYPSIFHVLDHPELRDLFSQYDTPANSAKRRSLRAGIAAIICGFLALAIASLEIQMSYLAADGGAPAYPFLSIEKVVAAASGLCALASFLIGTAGILFARRKREWLYNRLMGESIRQFHFQTFVFQMPQILASLNDDKAISAFVSAREIWFESFKFRFIGKLDAVFLGVTEVENGADIWLHGGERVQAKILETRTLEPLFEAYRELRILHQISYADYKLHDDHRIFSAMSRRQLVTLGALNVAWIVLLIVIHVSVVAGVVLPIPFLRTFATGGIAIVIIWIALAALATRAVEGGLQPEREVERYQQYRSAVRAILERYDAAPTQTAKREIMGEMERASFDEMRNFLITAERSTFVI
jgi:hypothetical protein